MNICTYMHLILLHSCICFFLDCLCILLYFHCVVLTEFCVKKLAGGNDHHQLIGEEELNNGIIPISYGLPDKQDESRRDTSGSKLVFCSAHEICFPTYEPCYCCALMPPHKCFNTYELCAKNCCHPVCPPGAEPVFRYRGLGHRMSTENYQILISV
jgi:hypothetical protein